MATTSIRELKEAGYLSEGQYSFTHQQILDAAARQAVDAGEAQSEGSLYTLLYDECDMAMAITLNEMDLSEYFDDTE